MSERDMRSPNRRHDIPLLNKYASAETTLKVLEHSSLRWSSPLLFNDPFDIPRQFGPDFTAQDLRQAVLARIHAYMRGEAHAAPGTVFEQYRELAGAEEAARDFMEAIMEAHAHLLDALLDRGMSEFREGWREKVRTMRILCLSAVADSPVMWAHYADQHRGVVLQFESNDERDSSTLLATPVEYRSEPPALPLVDRWARALLSEEEIVWDDYFHEYYYVKGLDWSYEKEYRVVSASLTDDELFTDMGFFREDLRGVVLGSAIQAESEQLILDRLTDYPNANAFRARIDYEGRRVLADPV